jgi:chromosome partitioning protein
MGAKTIVIAASKGGSGKTTLAAALGAHIAGLGEQVNLVDADPQSSLGLWWERRDWPENPWCIAAGKERDLSGTIKEAKARANASWVIVDLPGSLVRSDPAIQEADLVVIPVRPSMMDIEAVNPICELADEARVPRVFVVNAADKDWKLLGSAIEALADLGEVLEPSLRYHEGHASAMVLGKTAAELKGASSRIAKAEISAIWNAISKHASSRKRRA